jgi:hypothetical protein
MPCLYLGNGGTYQLDSWCQIEPMYEYNSGKITVCTDSYLLPAYMQNYQQRHDQAICFYLGDNGTYGLDF